MTQEERDAMQWLEEAFTGRGFPVDEDRAHKAVIKRMMAREWQPIESAPRDAKTIIVAQMTPGDWEGRVAVGYFWDRFWTCLDCPGLEPTHWQPLPSPPSGT